MPTKGSKDVLNKLKEIIKKSEELNKQAKELRKRITEEVDKKKIEKARQKIASV